MEISTGPLHKQESGVEIKPGLLSPEESLLQMSLSDAKNGHFSSACHYFFGKVSNIRLVSTVRISPDPPGTLLTSR